MTSIKPKCTTTNANNFLKKSFVSFFVALIVIAVLFGDIAFLGSSLQPSNIVGHAGKPANYKAQSYLEFTSDHIKEHYGFMDLGATAWQSEPMRRFVARSLRNGESIFWNPYSAGGALGIETLVDLKTSLLTLLSVPFNASSLSFDYLLLLLFLVSTFSLFRVLLVYFQLHPAAALAGVVVFLLNGYASVNFNSQNGQAYFFAPIVLWSLIRFLETPTYARWSLYLFTTAGLLSITLLPVTFLMLVTIQLIGLCWLLDRGFHAKDFVKRLLVQGVTPFLSILLMAPIWFPIISFLVNGDLLGTYSNRQVHLQDVDNLLSVFTSKHYWETYLGYKPVDWLRANDITLNNVMIPHLGVVAALITGFGFLLKKTNKSLALLSLFIIVGIYARYFNIWPFVDMAYWPIINSISLQYFGSMVGLFFTFCFAISFSSILQEEKKLSLLGLAVIILIVYAFLHLFFKLGWPQ